MWQGTQLLVPGMHPHWHRHNVLTGEVVVFTENNGEPTLALAQLLQHYPGALLVAPAYL